MEIKNIKNDILSIRNHLNMVIQTLKLDKRSYKSNTTENQLLYVLSTYYFDMMKSAIFQLDDIEDGITYDMNNLLILYDMLNKLDYDVLVPLLKEYNI